MSAVRPFRFIRVFLSIWVALPLGETLLFAQSGVTVDSKPPGATVTVKIEGVELTCATPCNIDLHHYNYAFDAEGGRYPNSKRLTSPVEATITKEGYLPQKFVITQGPLLWHADRNGRPPTDAFNCPDCTRGTNKIEKYYYFIPKAERTQAFNLQPRATDIQIAQPTPMPKPPGSDYDAIYKSALAKLQKGDPDGALAEAKSLFGTPKDTDARALAGRIYDQRFESARAKYQSGDKDAARSALKALYGTYRDADARSLITKLDNYDSTLGEGETALSSKNYSLATEKFKSAADSVPDSPPLRNAANARFTEADNLLKADILRKKQDDEVVAWRGVLSEAQAAYASGNLELARRKLEQLSAAPREIQQQGRSLQKQINDYLQAEQEARRDEARKDWTAAIAAWNRARRIVSDSGALVADIDNRTKFGQQQIALASQSAEEVLLAAIRDFYSAKTSRYTDSESELETYVAKQGQKLPFAYFYLGAAEWSQSIRTAPKSAESLQQKARTNWAKAKRYGFQPNPRYVSPRIIQAYNAL